MAQRYQQMIQRKHLHLLFSLLIGVLLTAAWRLFSRRPRERIPSHEGLEEPDVAEGFNRVARMPQMHLMRWFVARRATNKTPRGRAVDLGCGPGYLVTDLISQAPDLHVTGIDLSDEMLAEAEAHAQRHGAGQHASFRKGDVQQIPFPDNSLDLVVSTLSLHHWLDPVAVLDEISRVLRPGGSFLIFDLRRDLSAPLWLLLWFATRFVVPPALRRVNEPLGSRDAAYTFHEAVQLAQQSRLTGGRVTRGPLWLTIEGTHSGASRVTGH
jgi:ubiquinone/menaquinone biosynthesis C-methylase UbiE